MSTTSNRKFSTRDLAMIGVLTALIFAANWLSVPIPTAIDNTRFHLGNVMCLLAGYILGPLGGGLAAGFGGMFYDFTNPQYASEAWMTFLMKFAMGWLCGIIAWSRGANAERIRRNTVAAICGAALYVLLYVTKNFLQNYVYYGLELTPVLLMVAQKGLVSAVNGVIAVVCAVPLNTALRAALIRAHLWHP